MRSSLYLRVAVRRAQASNLGDRDGGVNEDVILVNQVPILVTVHVGHKGLRDVQEVVALSQHLCSHAGVYARGRVVLVARAVDVRGSEPDGRKARVDVGKVVVVVCDVELALVLARIAVRVPD